MATSGSSNFSQNRTAIILKALSKLGVYGIGRTVSSEDMTLASDSLNMMVKSWSTAGLHLWCKSEGVLYLDQYQAQYSLGNASTDARVTNKSDEVITKLNGALAASATSLTVDSTTGMTIGDQIGIVLSSKDIHWTTIATIPGATSLTITLGASTAASDNALVFTYTNRLYKPLRMLNARCVTGFDSGATSTISEIPMTVIPYQSYFDFPAKTSNGTPIQLHYNPKLTSGNAYVWPRPSDCSYRIEFSYERILEDLDNATDDFDFPSEWQEPLVWQLAARLAPDYGKEDKAVKMILPAAMQMLSDLKDWDAEVASVQFMPDDGL